MGSTPRNSHPAGGHDGDKPPWPPPDRVSRMRQADLIFVQASW